MLSDIILALRKMDQPPPSFLAVDSTNQPLASKLAGNRLQSLILVSFFLFFFFLRHPSPGQTKKVGKKSRSVLSRTLTLDFNAATKIEKFSLVFSVFMKE